VITAKLTAWRRKASGLSLSLLAFALVSSGASAGGTSVSPQLHTLTATHVPLAVASAQTARTAALPAQQHLNLALSLPLRNQTELHDLLQQLQDPNSPNYHHYLSVEEFTVRFGPTQADYDEVVSWAQAKGFTVTDKPVNRRLVAAYTLAAAFAGVAGALLAQTTAFVSLEFFDFNRSADVLLVLIIGGAGWLYGGIVGAVLFQGLQDGLSSLTPEYWLFWIGLFLVAFVMLGRDRMMAGLRGLVARVMP